MKYLKKCKTNECNHTKEYSYKVSYESSNWICSSCSYKNKKVLCSTPDCNNLMGPDVNMCKSCSSKENLKQHNHDVKMGIKPNSFSNRTHTKETRKLLSEQRKGLNTGDNNPSKRPEVRKKISDTKLKYTPYKGKTYEEYYGVEKARELKRGKRLARAEQIIDGKMHPTFYNKRSIPIIEQYGNKNGYTFQHAENGGEVCIDGYFVDGYDEEKNVVIEFYERHHYNTDGKLKLKEINREQDIINYLQCDFIRIHAFEKYNLNFEKLKYERN